MEQHSKSFPIFARLESIIILLLAEKGLTKIVKCVPYLRIRKKYIMKKLMYVLVVLAVASCQQDKIGYVDNVKLLDDYLAKQDVEAKFKVKADALAKKRDSISQAFQLEAQAFQAKAAKMSQKKAQEEYGQMQQRGQLIGQQLQQQDQQLQSEGQLQMDSIIKDVKKEIQDYGEANGYTYILGGGEGGSVLYGAEVNDLTDEIVKILNDKYSK